MNNAKELPDEERAQIAKILLKDERKKIERRPTLPVLKLLKTAAAPNLAVEFFRVSSEGQREGYSLEAQRDKSAEYIKSLGLKCVNSWSVTESASKELDRKKFFEMLEYVSMNGIRNVIFDKIDRACRGLRAAVMIEDLVEAGVCFHFTRDNLVVNRDSSPGEKLRFYLGVVLAKHYIDNLRIEIKKGMDQRWEDGYWNSMAPVGYKNVRDDNGRAKIELDEKVARYIAEAFELYSTGNYSYKALAEFLKGKAVVVLKRVREDVGGEISKKKEFQPITDRCIEKMICNPFYYGARTKNGATVMTGNEKHAPIISKDLFDRCQRVKSIRAESTRVSLSHEIAKPFMNFMKCGVCGNSVTGEVHKKASGKVYIYYHCASHDCPERRINVRQEEILSRVVEAFEPFSKFTPKTTAAFIENVKTSASALSVFSAEQSSVLEAKKAAIEKRCQDIKTLVEKGAVTEEEFNCFVDQKRKVLGEIDIEIVAHTKASQETLTTSLRVIELLQKSRDFMQLGTNLLDKARLAKVVLSNPILKGGSLEFSYRKEFDLLVELTRGRNWWRRRELNPGPQVIHIKAKLHA